MDGAWSTAVPDWEHRIRTGQSLVPALPLNQRYVGKALTIFKRLRAPDVPGTPMLGEVCDVWVFDFVSALFGSYDPETRERAIQEYFLMVPKKNYKSGLASGIMLTAMILNDRPNAEMVLVAETQKISGISFANVRGMIRLDPDLSDLFHVIDHQKKIRHLRTEAELAVVSADGDVVTGSKASCVLVDEAHVLGMKVKAPAVYLELRGGLAARPEGFFLQITTQSKVPPAGQFKKELAQARASRDGKSDARVLSVLYEYPPDMLEAEAWRDETTWGLVNPNLGRSVSPDFLRAQYERALNDGPSELALFASQHLNVEIGGLGFGDGWAAQRYWQAAEAPWLTLDQLLDRSEVVTIGVDGGADDDLCGLAVIGRERETRRWLTWTHAWCQPEVLDLRKKIAPQLMDFQNDGDLTICAHPMQHVEDVVQQCLAIRDRGLLPEKAGIGVDLAGLPELQDALAQEGIVDPLLVAVTQGWRLGSAVKSIPLRLKSKTLVHAAQPLMTWSVSNAKVELKGSNPMITKQLAGSAKIDPVIALLNAAMLMFLNPQALDTASVYEDRGILVL
jgi:phage terminase large subunit-like protein